MASHLHIEFLFSFKRKLPVLRRYFIFCVKRLRTFSSYILHYFFFRWENLLRVLGKRGKENECHGKLNLASQKIGIPYLFRQGRVEPILTRTLFRFVSLVNCFFPSSYHPAICTCRDMTKVNRCLYFIFQWSKVTEYDFPY